MRYLFVNQYYSPDFAATAQQMSDLCERLAKQGHEVHVLASRAVYDGRKLSLPEYEILNGVHVHRIGLEVSGRERLRERFLGYLSFFLKAFVRATFFPKPDVAVVLTTPPLIGLLGAWLRLTRGVRFVYWVMDIYPDIAIQAGVLSRVGPIRAVWSLIGRISYEAADKIVVLGHDMREVVCRKLIRSSHHKVEVVRSWPGNADVHPIPAEENNFRTEKLAPASVLSVMYSGNMGTCHAFKAAIPAIQGLAGRRDVHFSFVGGGKQQPKLAKELGEQKENVVFLPYQDRADLSLSLSAPDVHLVALQPQYDGLLVPSKIYGILAAGRAVLFAGSQNNEVARIIAEAKCGLVVSPDDPEEFTRAIEWMIANREEVAAMGARGRQFFEENLQTEYLTGLFAQILESEGSRKGIARSITRPISPIGRMEFPDFAVQASRTRRFELDESAPTERISHS